MVNSYPLRVCSTLLNLPILLPSTPTPNLTHSTLHYDKKKSSIHSYHLTLLPLKPTATQGKFSKGSFLRQPHPKAAELCVPVWHAWR